MTQRAYVALLRAVNVGGRNKVAMAELRELAAAIGLADPRTLLQSGNLVFESDGRTAAVLETMLEAECRKRLNVAADFIVRTADEWSKIIHANPYPDAAERDPSHLVVMPLKEAPAAAAIQALREAIKGRETLHAIEKQLYLVYPDGIGTSKLTNTVIERKLGIRGTARNWNTVVKLAVLAAASSA
jgi:uncharacterized protein (DUF1697 family)